ncbi:hydrolase [Dawidia soli]
MYVFDDGAGLLDSNDVASIKDYIYFPYCPKCAKKYGHTYIVVSQIRAI